MLGLSVQQRIEHALRACVCVCPRWCCTSCCCCCSCHAHVLSCFQPGEAAWVTTAAAVLTVRGLLRRTAQRGREAADVSRRLTYVRATLDPHYPQAIHLGHVLLAPPPRQEAFRRWVCRLCCREGQGRQVLPGQTVLRGIRTMYRATHMHFRTDATRTGTWSRLCTAMYGLLCTVFEVAQGGLMTTS